MAAEGDFFRRRQLTWGEKTPICRIVTRSQNATVNPRLVGQVDARAA
jgi:hypothetical protein